jgi:hypothetical protein
MDEKVGVYYLYHASAFACIYISSEIWLGVMLGLLRARAFPTGKLLFSLVGIQIACHTLQRVGPVNDTYDRLAELLKKM